MASNSSLTGARNNWEIPSVFWGTIPSSQRLLSPAKVSIKSSARVEQRHVQICKVTMESGQERTKGPSWAKAWQTKASSWCSGPWNKPLLKTGVCGCTGPPWAQCTLFCPHSFLSPKGCTPSFPDGHPDTQRSQASPASWAHTYPVRELSALCALPSQPQNSQHFIPPNPLSAGPPI